MRFMRLTPLLRKLQVLRKSRLKKLMVCVKTPLKKCQLFHIIKLSLIRSKEEGLGLKVYPPSVELEIAV